MKALFANQSYQLPPLYPFWHKERKKGEEGERVNFPLLPPGHIWKHVGCFYYNDLGDNRGNTNIRWVGHGCETL